MTDLFEAAETTNIPEFSVSALSGAVKRTIEDQFGRVRIRGEVGRVSKPRSGHWYLDLKDENAVLAAIMWKGVVAKLSVLPEEGMEIFATGRVTTFAGQSKYQLIIDDVTPAGAGALMAMLEQRRQMFIKEGLFEARHKRPLPFLPKTIGVVTSPSGAVIRDILHRVQDRFPGHILLWPISAQGTQCAPSVVTALDGFNNLKKNRPDVIIVARGGGSLEDLWGFNEESVVRAVARSQIPVISAIGHETDTTLIDYVADRRAPTPTAAAEIAVPVHRDLVATVQAYDARLQQNMARRLELSAERLSSLVHRLPDPHVLLQDRMQRLDVASHRLPQALIHMTAIRQQALLKTLQGFTPRVLLNTLRAHRQTVTLTHQRLHQSHKVLLDKKRDSLKALPVPKTHLTRQITTCTDRLHSLSRVLETLSYKSTLKRGYSVVRTLDNSLVSSVNATTPSMKIEFCDGAIDVALKA